MLDGLRRCAALADGLDIELVVEAVNDYSVPGYFLNRTKDAIDLVRLVDHPKVRLVIDTFHHQMASGRLADHIVEGLPQLASLHVSDLPDRCPPGWGEINFAAVKQTLRDHGYDGQLTFEIKPVGGDSDAAIQAVNAAFPL